MGNPFRGPVHIRGTLVWYYAICPREAWLMGHAIEPWHDHERMSMGRLLHATAYPRAKHEISLPGMKVDLIEGKRGTLIAAEVKLSRGAAHAHRLQLAYYLMRLEEEEGVKATGELRYPRERRVERVNFTPELRREVEQVINNLNELLMEPKPPPAKRIKYCSGCAYYNFCWVDEA
ncbi:CRISPR-associated protein Cas4 [Oceanithermus sp.]